MNPTQHTTPIRTIYHVEDGDEVQALLPQLLAAPLLGIDFETIPSASPKLVGETLTPSEAAAVRHWNNHRALSPVHGAVRLVSVSDGLDAWVFDCQSIAITTLAPLFTRPWTAFNAVFELGFLMKAGIAARTPECSYLAIKALTSRAMSLAEAMAKYADEHLNKAEQQSDWAVPLLSEAQIVYAAADARAAKKLWDIVKPALDITDNRMCYELYKEVQPIVCQQHLTGIRFNEVAHQALIKQWTEERLSAEKALCSMLQNHGGATAFKLNSSAHWRDYLAQTLDAPTKEAWGTTAKGALSTDKIEFSLHPELPISAPKLRYSRFSTLLNSFGPTLAYKHVSNGRIHCHFHPGGAATGRFTCSSPNLQQMPRDNAMRKLFLADPGHHLIALDYSQIEVRAAALLSKDRKLLALYRKPGNDVYKETARNFLDTAKIAFDALDVSEQKRYRNMAKTVVLASLYGMGPTQLVTQAKLHSKLDLTLDEAKQWQQAFRRQYPQLAKWQRLQGYKNDAGETRIGIYMEFYRHLWTETSLSEDERLAGAEHRRHHYCKFLNTPVQGICAVLLLLALRQVHLKIPKDARVLASIHDEILLQAPIALSGATAAIAQSSMCWAFGYIAGYCGFAEHGMIEDELVDTHIGTTWAESD